MENKINCIINDLITELEKIEIKEVELRDRKNLVLDLLQDLESALDTNKQGE